MKNMEIITFLMCFRLVTASVLDSHSEASSELKELVVKEMKNIENGVNENLSKMNDVISEISKQMDNMNERLENLECMTINNELQSINRKSHVDGYSNEVEFHYTAVACQNEFLRLSCPENQSISLANATYGYYAFACALGCCPPNPTPDCFGYVNATYPEDWVYLVYTCEGRRSCEYQYKEAVIEGCAENGLEIADYMQVFYGCTPLPDELPPVAFTAHSNSSEYLQPGQITRFQKTFSNIGGHYNPATSSFVCPYHGVYVFSIHFGADSNNRLNLVIVIDGVATVQAFAETHYERTTGSALVVSECGPSQMVWVETWNDGIIEGQVEGLSHFSGYLLYAY